LVLLAALLANRQDLSVPDLSVDVVPVSPDFLVLVVDPVVVLVLPLADLVSRHEDRSL
jgi:hypothetical protein